MTHSKEPKDKNNEGVLDIHIHFRDLHALEKFLSELKPLMKKHEEEMTHATVEGYELIPKTDNQLN